MSESKNSDSIIVRENMISHTDFGWYVLRVPYGREMILKELFDDLGVETYIPMQMKDYYKDGELSRRSEPVVRNLLFVYAMRVQLDELKPQVEVSTPFRYYYDRATQDPIVIPERQMRHFITVAGSSDDQHLFVDTEGVAFSKGDRVRVIAGPFAGIVGVFMRLKGNRRVVISLLGLMTVATAFIHPSLVEKIEN